MTARTHDLAALASLIAVVAYYSPMPTMTVGTALTAFGANMIGGLLPDIDDTTSDFWDTVRGGSMLGKIIKPLLGGHRMISHSLLGLGLAGFIIKYILKFAQSFLLVDMNIVWWSVMIGFMSHLVMDTFTKEGVPWLFPIPVRIGIPPFKFMRVKTGGAVEKALIFPGLFVLTAYIIYSRYSILQAFFSANIQH